MFITTRESCLFREGFKSTLELFALLGRDELKYSYNWLMDSMGLCSAVRGSDKSSSDRLLDSESMEYWYWRRRCRQENSLKTGTVKNYLCSNSGFPL